MSVPWILPGPNQSDTRCYLVVLKDDKQSLTQFKQATLSSVQGMMDAWYVSDEDILRDIYKAAVKNRLKQIKSPSSPGQVKTALLQEFQFGRVVAFEARREIKLLQPVTVQAVSKFKVSMEGLLKQTLLHATGAPLKDFFNGPQRLTPLGTQARKDLRADKALIQAKKVWEYQHPTLDTVTQVTARHREMGDMPMPVLDSITWGEVSAKLYSGAEISLPLSQAFLLRTESVDEAVLPVSNTGFWQLPANLHASFHHLFGYEITSSGRVQAIADPTKGPILPIGSNQPFRILVCLALGCTGERNEFEPGGVLGAARLLPHLMIAANKMVESVQGAITLKRNERTPHLVMDDDEMTPEISIGLYTDNNDTTVTPDLPLWNIMFDYYWTDPLPGRFEVVKRNARKRTSVDAVQYFHEEVVSGPGGSMGAGASYVARDVIKMARQGEFDNIHMAPKMKLPREIVSKAPAAWNLNQPVAMAPFCVHDCLHTHWRWGNLRYEPFDSLGINPKWVRGWSGGSATSPGKPYSEPGAPLVPCNQDVTIHLLDKRSFKYVARAYAPAVNEWQIIMHHGSAYAISNTALVDGIQGFLGSMMGPPIPMSNAHWARFYWGLRYGTYVYNKFTDANPGLPASSTGAKYAERLKLDSATLAKLRAL